MNAHVGDRLVLAGANVGDARRVGIILEVPDPDGSPPYRVRWLADGHEGLIYPGRTPTSSRRPSRTLPPPERPAVDRRGALAGRR